MVNAFQGQGVGVHSTKRFARTACSGPACGIRSRDPNLVTLASFLKLPVVIPYDVGPVRLLRPIRPPGASQRRLQKMLGTAVPLWYYLVAFDALVSPLEREESGREVTLAAFFYVRPKTARLCEGLGKAPDSSI